MYAVTGQHGAAFPAETERLWSTVAGNRRNVVPILDFLISRGLQEAAYAIAAAQARRPPLHVSFFSMHSRRLLVPFM